jgi:hypothetical protein
VIAEALQNAVTWEEKRELTIEITQTTHTEDKIVVGISMDVTQETEDEDIDSYYQI